MYAYTKPSWELIFPLIKFHINQTFISGSIPPEIGNLGTESLHFAE